MTGYQQVAAGFFAVAVLSIVWAVLLEWWGARARRRRMAMSPRAAAALADLVYVDGVARGLIDSGDQAERLPCW